MKLSAIQDHLPIKLYEILSAHITELRPAQEKAIDAGLLEGKNLLICTPTASGKTLIAELASVKCILEGRGKAIYIVPLKALAAEKYKDFVKRYGSLLSIALSMGDLDRSDQSLSGADLIIVTSEKLDSLLRHHAPWVSKIGVIVVDEVHLLGDPGRGPTLEIILTLLRKIVPGVQIVSLSATIGNPKELSEWLRAELVEDQWRPVKLKKGILYQGEIEFFGE